MPDQPALAFEQALGVLRQFRGPRRSASRAERCELCSAELIHDHPHLVELVSRQILCACDGCALLFDGTERLKFKRVSRSIRSLSEFEMTDAEWNNLVIPINLAFFFAPASKGEWWRSIRARREQLNPCCRSIRGLRSRRRIRCWDTSNPIPKPFSSIASTGERRGFLRGTTSRRSTNVTNLSASCGVTGKDSPGAQKSGPR